MRYGYCWEVRQWCGLLQEIKIKVDPKNAIMPEINVTQLLDKTLIARRKVNIYRGAYDDALSYGYVAAGQPVGVVYSWVDPSPSVGRSGVWIMFYQDSSNTYYYTPWVSDAFDVDALRRAGVLTVDEVLKQQAEEQRRAKLSWWQLAMEDYGKPIILTGLALFALPRIIDAVQNKRG